jgi:hypothetical protein
MAVARLRNEHDTIGKRTVEFGQREDDVIAVGGPDDDVGHQRLPMQGVAGGNTVFGEQIAQHDPAYCAGRPCSSVANTVRCGKPLSVVPLTAMCTTAAAIALSMQRQRSLRRIVEVLSQDGLRAAREPVHKRRRAIFVR